jgi:hypothetical protein
MNSFEDVKAFVGSPEGQIKIRDWAEALREKVGNRTGYLDLVMANNDKAIMLDVNTVVKKLFKMLGVNAVANMGPGHDIGHLRRDLLTALVVYNSVGGHPADKLAGLVAGVFHDIGNMMTARYLDKENNASHAFVSAWMLSQMAKNVLPSGIVDLACYAVLAHTHYLADIPTKKPAPFVLKPFWDELWESDGVLIGVAIRICRWSDRADANGVTLISRHMISKCDAQEEGGQDLSGSEWTDVQGDGFRAIFAPETGYPFPKCPSAVQHAKNFIASNYRFASPYAKDDYINPEFSELIRFKANQLRAVERSIDDTGISALTIEEIKEMVINISGSSSLRFQSAWNVFMYQWSILDDNQKKTWGRIFHVIKVSYNLLLAHYAELLSDSQFADLASETLSKLYAQ